MINKLLKQLISIIVLIIGNYTFAYANNDLVIGKENAPITMEIYSSPTCPYCAILHLKVIPKLKKNYTDKGKLIITHKDFPLDIQGLNAGKISKCIEKEKLFDFFNIIYSEQKKWSIGKNIEEINTKLKAIALKFNINNKKFDECISDKKIEELVLNSRIQGTKKYNINATPTIIINNTKYAGDYTYSAISKFIESIK